MGTRRVIKPPVINQHLLPTVELLWLEPLDTPVPEKTTPGPLRIATPVPVAMPPKMPPGMQPKSKPSHSLRFGACAGKLAPITKSPLFPALNMPADSVSSPRSKTVPSPSQQDPRTAKTLKIKKPVVVIIKKSSIAERHRAAVVARPEPTFYGALMDPASLYIGGFIMSGVFFYCFFEPDMGGSNLFYAILCCLFLALFWPLIAVVSLSYTVYARHIAKAKLIAAHDRFAALKSASGETNKTESSTDQSFSIRRAGMHEI